MDSSAGICKCRPHKAAGRCPAPAIVSLGRLERIVAESVRHHLETVPISYQAVERGDAIAEAERELEAAEAELIAYQTLVKISEVGAEHFAEGMRQRVEAVEAARRKLARARLASPALPSGQGLASLTGNQWRAGLRGALGVVWVFKGRPRARIKIIAAGFEPSEFGAIDWTDIDLPGEVRVLDS